jgi:hypothetical protein
MTDYEQDPDVCSSALGEDGTPLDDLQTNHKWDYEVVNYTHEVEFAHFDTLEEAEQFAKEANGEVKPAECSECGALKD